MNKIIAAVVAMFIAVVLFAGPASATPGHGGGNEVEGKDVTLCHATGSNQKPYPKVTIDINGFLSGHADHDGDIWAAFTYYERTGPDTYNTVNVAAQGDQSILANDCEVPRQPIKVTPVVSVVDECGVKNDSVSVSTNEGYTSSVTKNGLSYLVYVKAKQGYVLDLDRSWTVSDDGQQAQKVFRLTDENCDLPETGGAAQYNTVAGAGALAGIAVLGGAMVLTRRKTA